MRAKKMFEKYGFVLYDETDERLMYCRGYDIDLEHGEHYIIFDKLYKYIYSNKEIDVYELKMINKQIEELGWK